MKLKKMLINARWHNRHYPILIFSILLAIAAHFQFTTRSAPAADEGQCQNNQILFIGSTRPLARMDEPLHLYLRALGQAVTVRSADEVRQSDADGKDLIMISESVESGKINTKFRAVAIPIVTWEGWLQDDLAMTAAGNRDATVGSVSAASQSSPTDKDEGAYGENIGQRSIQIINGKHPLAAGFEGEVTTVDAHAARFHWGVPASDAIRIAHDIEDERHTMFYAYEQGAMMVGLRAPARRVFIHNANAPSLTNTGLTLVLNAAFWAMGCLDEPDLPTPTPTKHATPASTAEPTPLPTATPLPTVTPLPTATAPLITFEMRDFLFNDVDSNDQVTEGDTLLYIVDLKNRHTDAITEIVLEDQLDPGTVLLAGTVQSSTGAITGGNQAGDQKVVVQIARLAPKESLQISFQVRILPTHGRRYLRNQATMYFPDQVREPAGQQQYLSDDPDTPDQSEDATLTPVGIILPISVYLPWIAR